MRYFKFDFLLWLDCLEGPDGARDLYEFHDAFVAMLDRLRADHPEVTFQIDETNDYRLFPFESVTRGPTWFQNGGPDVAQHAAQPLEPEPVDPGVRARAERFGERGLRRPSVDTLMAAALLSHITFFHDPRDLPDAVIDRVGVWSAFYKAQRGVARRRRVSAAGRSAGARLDGAAVVGPGARRGRAAGVPPGTPRMRRSGSR